METARAKWREEQQRQTTFRRPSARQKQAQRQRPAEVRVMSMVPDVATRLMLRSQTDQGRLHDMRAECRGLPICHS